MTPTSPLHQLVSNTETAAKLSRACLESGEPSGARPWDEVVEAFNELLPDVAAFYVPGRRKGQQGSPFPTSMTATEESGLTIARTLAERVPRLFDALRPLFLHRDEEWSEERTDRLFEDAFDSYESVFSDNAKWLRRSDEARQITRRLTGLRSFYQEFLASS